MYQTSYDFYGQHYIKNEYAKVIHLINESIITKIEHERFYNDLIDLAPTKKEKEIIITIRDDEINHLETLKKIYKYLTGQNPIVKEYISLKKPKTYLTGIDKALFSELTLVEKYREIRKEITNSYYRDLLLDIITDELCHANKYNYILIKNKK